MKFVDEAEIHIEAGDGGRGCLSFRREKFVPHGGPDGGDGGKGGDVVIVADAGRTTLLDFRYQKHYRGERGAHGKGKNMTGRSGDDAVLPVPVGTVIIDTDLDEELGELVNHGDKLVVAKGGDCGRGNARFATSTNKAPLKTEPGWPGESRTIRLVLKLLADVGLVGLPNAGKSTLISTVSHARPKIADYPFTTLVPNLGVVQYGDYKSFVMVDLPGLIEGAHLGKGLGDHFLKHIERTRLILHLVDISTPDPVADYEQIHNELTSYGMGIEDKPEIVVLTKIDLIHNKVEVTKLLKKFQSKKLEVHAISSVARRGLDELVNSTAKKLG